MTRDDILSLVRHLLLSVLGGYLIGKNFFGIAVDQSVVAGLVGVVLSLAGIVFSILDKTLNIEKLQGTVREILSTVGGIFVGAGKISLDNLNTIIGVIVSLLPLLQGFIARKKAAMLASSEIHPQQLSGAVPK